MGFESIGLLVAGAATATLTFYVMKFIIEVTQGKYKE